MHCYYFILLLTIRVGYAWKSDQMEILDAIEEVNANFYNFLNVYPDADRSEIKTAFRKLSILWHPDKNPDEDTSIKFRNLLTVYKILEDPKKRALYDKTLHKAVPSWESPVFYHRHVRKIGLLESIIIIGCFFTIAQYVWAWCVYLEFLYTRGKSIFDERFKWPSILDTLPFQLVCLIYTTSLLYVYTCIKDHYNVYKLKSSQKQNFKILSAEIKKMLLEEKAGMY